MWIIETIFNNCKKSTERNIGIVLAPRTEVQYRNVLFNNADFQVSISGI